MLKTPGEKRIIWSLFAFSLASATSYTIARTAADSLFLSRVGNQFLAVIFVLAGLTTAVAAVAWFFLTRRMTIASSIQYSSLWFMGANLLFWYLLPSNYFAFWLLASIYLMVEIKGCINAINMVSVLNSKLGREGSKMAWAIIGVAAPVASVIAGALLAIEYEIFSLRSWLLVSAIIDGIVFIVGVLIGRIPNVKTLLNSESKTTRAEAKLKKKRKRRIYVAPSSFRLWIGALIAAKIVTLTIMTFEWKATVNIYYEGQPNELVRYFGIFYGVVGVTTIFIQLLLTNRLMLQRNYSLPLLMMPVILFGAALTLVAGVGIFVAFMVTTFGKGIEAWRRSVHDTTLNRLYTRIEREQRRSAISMNTGIVKPLAEVLAACAVFLFASTIYLPVMLLAIVVWIASCIRLVRLVQAPPKDRTENGDDAESAFSEK